MAKSIPTQRLILLRAMLLRLFSGYLLMAFFLFAPAGTLAFWEAWLYLGVLLLPITVFGFILLIKAPHVLEARMRMQERDPQQKRAIAILSLILLMILIIPGFDQRYGWSDVPAGVVIAADVLILLGYLIFVLTVRENQFASRVVEVQQEQVVISTDPYAFVRHPMYLGFSLIFVMTPLALGSYWALIPAVFFPVALGARIANEEALLLHSLSGYEEYIRKVKYRLIPFIW